MTKRLAIHEPSEEVAYNILVLRVDPTLHIQTHLAENPAEIEFTKQLFPFADSYTQGESSTANYSLRVVRLAHAMHSSTVVYDHFGLLTKKTVLAHCVHLEDSEMQLIKRTQSGISHCPT